jgi:DNA-binding Xre family transcriptional regulator
LQSHNFIDKEGVFMVKSSEKDNDKQKGNAVVRSRLKELVALKEQAEQRTIQHQEIATATGLNPNTISNWMKPAEIKKIDSAALTALCAFLGCGIGDLLYIDYSAQAHN